ncbi:MAG: murein biosynthesis integral membrane protein MurJ [Rhodobacteraceae bacterium]|nr:murein biosynthesis integral membrane protein MurJ [Paracoccaceae bacterium]
MRTPAPLAHNFITVGVWTLASRILGFVRDIVLAALLGAGPVAEAFLIAFSLPNMFRRIFAEGAFNTAFVPIFSKKLESGEGAAEFASEAFATLSAFLILFTLLAQLVMPVLVVAMASGFLGDSRFELAVIYGRIAFPYILFISLAALLSGVLNSTGRFAAAAAAPTLLNVAFIGALTGAHLAEIDPGLTLVWTVPIAGVGQFALVWIAAARAGFLIRLRLPSLSPEMRRLAVIAAPAALAGGVVQVNLLIGRQVASVFEGAVAWLNYADRLYQLPLGVVGIAIGIVLLPDLSRKLESGDAAGARAGYSRAAETALALAVPAALALAVIPLPIISILFERGQFTHADAQATAAALAIYAVGLPAFVLQKVVQPLFFARHDTRTPFNCAVAALAINAVVAVGLASQMGFLASALGATIAGWSMLILLWSQARKFGEAAMPDAGFRRTLPKILLSALIMGGCLWLFSELTYESVAASPVRFVWLAGLVSGGIAIHGGLLHLTGAVSMAEIRRALRRN